MSGVGHQTHLHKEDSSPVWYEAVLLLRFLVHVLPASPTDHILTKDRAPLEDF